MNLPFAGTMKTVISGNFKPFFKEDFDRKLQYYFYLNIKIKANSVTNLPELIVETNSSFEDGRSPKAFDLITVSIIDFEGFKDDVNIRQVVNEYVKQACNEHIKIVKNNLEKEYLIEQAIWKYDDEKLSKKIEDSLSLFFINHKE